MVFLCSEPAPGAERPHRDHPWSRRRRHGVNIGRGVLAGRDESNRSGLTRGPSKGSYEASRNYDITVDASHLVLAWLLLKSLARRTGLLQEQAATRRMQMQLLGNHPRSASTLRVDIATWAAVVGSCTTPVPESLLTWPLRGMQQRQLQRLLLGMLRCQRLHQV